MKLTNIMNFSTFTDEQILVLYTSLDQRKEHLGTLLHDPDVAEIARKRYDQTSAVYFAVYDEYKRRRLLDHSHLELNQKQNTTS